MIIVFVSSSRMTSFVADRARRLHCLPPPPASVASPMTPSVAGCARYLWCLPPPPALVDPQQTTPSVASRARRLCCLPHLPASVHPLLPSSVCFTLARLEARPGGIYTFCGGIGSGEDRLAVGGMKASLLVKRVAAAREGPFFHEEKRVAAAGTAAGLPAVPSLPPRSSPVGDLHIDYNIQKKYNIFSLPKISPSIRGPDLPILLFI
jgi:hypothetical protein